MSYSCEICGLPDWAIAGDGVRIKLRQKAENSFRRDRLRTVWCCSRSCATQAFAIAAMGPASHKWPVSLAEFEAIHREAIDQAIRDTSDRPETPSQTRMNSGVTEAKLQGMALPHYGEVSGRSQANSVRSGGRPRQWNSEAERKRAERARRRALTPHLN